MKNPFYISYADIISQLSHDKLGQLITKKVGGTQNGNYRWQEVNYNYNIRGWLTNINDVGIVLYGKDANPPTMGDDLFAFKINYNQLNNGGSAYAEPLFNGNIAQTLWRTGEDNVVRGYVYNYDELNRLLNAKFHKNDNNPFTGAYNESLAYDVNGNIKSLFRTTGDANGNPIGMDDLSYGYKDGQGKSNLLLNVSDAVSNGNTDGFVDGNTNPNLNDYEYDQNGNMTKDRNKGIESITYNYLNLPEKITWSNNRYITYQYNAAGQKVTKTVRSNDSIKVVRYLDGFQYAGDILQFFPTAEGYVKATPVGSANPNLPPMGYAYNYVFNYTDHLGNIRVNYTKDPQTGLLKILDESHYYPFGLRHQKYSNYGFIDQNSQVIIAPIANNPYQYKYNGKELQDELGLDWYDYGARNYDATIGRWMNVDPLAEKYPDVSPYTFVLNNPIRYVDPDGRVVRDPNGNIVFTATNSNSMYTQYANTNQQTGVTTVVYFRATEGKILTDKGNEVTVFRANSPDVYIAEIDANGNVLSNNVMNQQFENGYNCTGNALTDQAFTISSDQITAQYLQDEGFVTLGAGQQTQAGDVGIYTDNASGIITHLEPFLTNNTVSTKGGIAVDQGPVAPGQSQQFSQGATYNVIRKTQPDQTVNIPNGATSNVNGGVNQVDNNTFNTIKQSLNP